MGKMSFLQKPRKSLGSILVGLFLLFSIAPLVFVTFIYYINSEKALNSEMLRRLDGNVREVNLVLEDYKSVLVRRSQKIKDNKMLLFYLSSSSFLGLNQFSKKWLEGGVESSVSFFSRQGQMSSTAFRNSEGEIERNFGKKVAEFFLPEDTLALLNKKNEVSFLEISKNGEDVEKHLTLLHYKKFFNSYNKPIGYVELSINLSHQFLEKLKERLGIELSILDKSGGVIISTKQNLGSNYFSQEAIKEVGKLLDANIHGENFGFTINHVDWGGKGLYLLVGASKKSAEKLREETLLSFSLVVLVIAFFLIIATMMTSRKIVRPINHLVIALQEFRKEEKAFSLNVKDATELGILTSSFNKMSQRVASSRIELRDKIDELEKTNRSLHETRAKLVHSAKMASLGQLVAGVAHELNNPIGFIHSNMVYLKEYSQALLKLAQLKFSGEEEEVEKFKETIEFDYMSEDLPRLIKSCEDGARRIKDIVLGLRNFSRLDEAIEKKIDIHECLEDTLQLLHGEIKTRVKVHREFSDIPEISCCPSELNQVFMNILSNAVQAIEKEGDIWIVTQIIEENSVSRLKISIRDNGKGMAEATVERIFDPFFTTKMVGEGTGLGLSISHGIIERHGGSIFVYSDLDKGTEFIIHLPIC